MTRKPGKWWRRIALFLVAVLLSLGLLLLLAYWRLSRDAVSLDWFETRIEAALNAELEPLSVDVGGGSFRWSGLERPVSIRFSQVRLYDREDSELVVLSGLSVDLSPSELLDRKVVPVRLDVEALRIEATRRQDGSWEISVGERQTADASEAPNLLDTFLEPPQPDRPLGQLTQVGIHRAELRVDDRKLGFTWAATEMDLELERVATGLQARITLEPFIEESLGRVTAEARYTYRDSSLAARVGFQALQVAALAPLHPNLGALRALEAPLEGWIEADLDGRLQPIGLRFDLTGAPLGIAGSVDFSAGLRSPAASLKVTGLEPWRFAGGGEKLAALDSFRLPLAGTLDVVFADGTLSSAKADLKAEPGELSLPGVYSQPLALGPTTLEATLTNGLDSVRLNELRTTVGESTLSLDLTADKTPEGYQGQLHGTVDRLQVERLSTYWPQEAAPGARAWVVENIPEGEVSNLELDLTGYLDSQAGRYKLRVKDLDVAFDIHDLSVVALAPQPPITGIEGRASLSEQNLAFEIEKGQLGEIEIGDSTVTIGDLDAELVDLAIQLECSTDVAAAIELISSEPLALIDEVVIAAEDVAGRARADVSIELPLAGGSEGRDTVVRVDAGVQDFAWQAAPLGLELSEGDLEVNYADSVLRIDGPVAAKGVPVVVDYRADFRGKGEQQVSARARLTKEDRDKLGVPDQTVVTGPVTVSASYHAEIGGPPSVTTEIDLLESQVEVPYLGWRKPVGEPGKATVAAISRDSSRWQISSVEVDAGELVARGNAELELNPTRLRSATIDQLEFGDNLLGGALSRDLEKGYIIRVHGWRFDASRLMRRLARDRKSRPQPGSERGGTVPLSLDVDLAEIVAEGEVILQDLSGRMRTDGDRLQSFEARALTRNDHELAASFGPVDRAYRGVLKAGDAGDLMRTLGVTTLFDGGEIQLVADRTDADAPIEIQLDIADLQIVESQVLDNILRLASLEGLLATLRGEGFIFRSVHGDLELDGGVLKLFDGKAYGEGIAVTLQGTLDTRVDEVDLQGLLAPTGAIQRKIGKIPGVGEILLGREKGGILGTRFKVTGPIDEPDVGAQPFSTFTPGILRELTRLTEEHPTPGSAD